MAEINNFIKDNKLKIIVKPNADKTEILGYDESKKTVKIAIAAPADKDKANKELIRFLSKILKRNVKIKSGLRSKEKTIIFV